MISMPPPLQSPPIPYGCLCNLLRVISEDWTADIGIMNSKVVDCLQDSSYYDYDEYDYYDYEYDYDNYD